MNFLKGPSVEMRLGMRHFCKPILEVSCTLGIKIELDWPNYVDTIFRR